MLSHLLAVIESHVRHSSLRRCGTGVRGSPQELSFPRSQGKLTCHPEITAGQVTGGSPTYAGDVGEWLGHSAGAPISIPIASGPVGAQGTHIALGWFSPLPGDGQLCVGRT